MKHYCRYCNQLFSDFLSCRNHEIEHEAMKVRERSAAVMQKQEPLNEWKPELMTPMMVQR